MPTAAQRAPSPMMARLQQTCPELAASGAQAVLVAVANSTRVCIGERRCEGVLYGL
jgi:hypothetical protein